MSGQEPPELGIATSPGDGAVGEQTSGRPLTISVLDVAETGHLAGAPAR
jgi:hypothetical protein